VISGADRADTLDPVRPADHETPRLPGYSHVSWLGSGGFADVYRAKREHLGRWVAIKVFKVTLSDKDAAEQFRAECDAVIRLDREPDVLVVHDAGILDDDRPFIVSELCDGSLQQLITQRGTLRPDDVATIGRRIATALEAAHFARVLHGDVTPHNILVRPSGAPVLADFGLAVLRDHRGNTAAGFNPAHAAPETVRHEGVLDERSDVYGLGSTLHTALTGRPPFPLRRGEPEAARLQRILQDPPPRAEDVPDGLADLVLAMLAKEPAKRPSVGEVASALARGAGLTYDVSARAGAGTSAPAGPRYAPPPGVPPASQAATRARAATPPQAPAKQEAAVPDPAPPPVPVSDGRTDDLATDRVTPAPRRRRAVLIGALVLVLAVVGTGAVLWLRTGTPTLPEVPAGAGPATIDLAPPQDAGTSVTLHWSADRTLDFAVIVAAGDAPASTKLVNRVTTYTVPVQPGVQYCFLVQGTDGRGQVVESKAAAIRGAICRFDPS
jgi:eukaryotic-like serine/threonine-protein kinase